MSTPSISMGLIQRKLLFATVWIVWIPLALALILQRVS